jgi:hypothetical protein
MMGMREFLGLVLAALKLVNDIPDRIFVLQKILRHTTNLLLEQKKSPARNLRTGVCVSSL